MFTYIRNKLNSWSTEGVKFLYAHDGTNNQKSVTLFFCYITFWIAAIGSVSVYFNSNLLTASINSTVFWFIAFITYRLRKLDSVKFDLDDKSFELSGEKNDEPK